MLLRTFILHPLGSHPRLGTLSGKSRATEFVHRLSVDEAGDRRRLHGRLTMDVSP
jgi:hypothetical protein